MTSDITVPRTNIVMSDRLTWSDIAGKRLAWCFVHLDRNNADQRMLIAQETISTHVSDSMAANTAPSAL
jgi:hypothetical protein